MNQYQLKFLIVKFSRKAMSQLLRFHVPFWISFILVYLFYLCSSLCPSLARKGHGNEVNDKIWRKDTLWKGSNISCCQHKVKKV